MSSAQLDIHPDDELAETPAGASPASELTEPGVPQPALKQEAAARVAAHRARRGQTAVVEAAPLGSETARSARPASSRLVSSRSAHIAAAVAERYAHSQSYRAFLAAEAERAVHQADAVAQVATINAQAIAVAQQQLLADLDSWQAPADGPLAAPGVALSPGDYAAVFDRSFASAGSSAAEPAATASRGAGFTVRPYEEVARSQATPRTGLRENTPAMGAELDEDERLALEDEIAFRHNPVFDAASEQAPIAANLIEFPRQLVAPRKARPRLAEGPLRDGEQGSAGDSQLRIFEVEADQISSSQAAESVYPEWSSILLSALPPAEFTESAEAAYLATFVPQAAAISSRLKAALVDGLLILSAQAAFTAVFVLALTHLPGQHAALDIPRPIAAGAALVTLAVFAALYQLIFFTLSDATPGMRFARIALCTFTDENPTRSAMRRRLFATLLAVFPLGLGVLWAFLDEDTLGWHDRISRMYQRSY